MKCLQVVLNIGKIEVEFVCENKGREAAVEYRHVSELEAQLFRRPKLFTPGMSGQQSNLYVGKKANREKPSVVCRSHLQRKAKSTDLV